MPDRYSKIVERLKGDLFGQRLIQNNLRGIFAEYMVAEALGDQCQIVSEGWNAWDLLVGQPTATYPDRIRIQVKNTAATQSWHAGSRRLTECQWSIKARKRPDYFVRDNPGVPCEPYGYLCDAFVLCHHPITDWEIADHRRVDQWDFYVVPVAGPLAMYDIVAPPEQPAKIKSFTVVPASLQRGIRGRRPVTPVKFDDLTIAHLRGAFGL